MKLLTERLVLRRARASELDALPAIMADICGWIGWGEVLERWREGQERKEVVDARLRGG